MQPEPQAKATFANDSFVSNLSTAGEIHAATEVDGKEPTNLQLAYRLLRLGFPVSVAVISQFSFIAVILAVVGQLGVNQLGGASLALGLINATGFAFAAGLCGGLETVLSHSYGRNPNSTMYGVYAQRMTLILLVVSVPLGVVLAFIDVFLEFLGQPPEVVYYTGVFCRVAMFAIPVAMMMQLLHRYYSCQHLTTPLSVSMIAAGLMNPVIQIVLVKIFGFVGSPIGWALLMFTMVMGLVVYLWKSGLYKKTWGGWDERSYENIMPLMKLALPSLGMMLSEWAALEVNSICAGFGTPVELAGFAISAQVFGMSWGIPSGVIILTCVFIGNAIGEGKPLMAKRIAIVSVVLVGIIALVDVLVCIALRNVIPMLYTDDEEVTAVYHQLMYVVLPYHVFDTFQSTIMAVLRGCGQQKIGAVVITIAFCVVGVPIGFILFFGLKYGVVALWIGPFIGVACVGTPIYVYVLLRCIDWENLKPHEEESGLSGLDEEACSPPAAEVVDDANANANARNVTATEGSGCDAANGAPGNPLGRESPSPA